MPSIQLAPSERAAILALAQADPDLSRTDPGGVILGVQILIGLLAGDMLRDLLAGDPALLQALRAESGKVAALVAAYRSQPAARVTVL